MKKVLLAFCDFILTITGYYGITYLFGLIFGYVYTPQGVVAAPNPINVTFSLLFMLSLIFVSFWSGYKSRWGIIFGIIIAVIVPLVCIPVIFQGQLFPAYFVIMVFIVPFSPVAELISEGLTRLFSVYASTVNTIIILNYIIAAIACIMGYLIRRNKTAKMHDTV